jgi:hypothetical protein
MTQQQSDFQSSESLIFLRKDDETLLSIFFIVQFQKLVKIQLKHLCLLFLMSAAITEWIGL